MDKQHGFAAVNDAFLYYEVNGTGLPVVFIHGGTLYTRMWDDQVLPFAQHYQVLRYDLRGYGRSTVPTQQPYARTDDLRGLLSYFDIEQAHVVGHSIGGGIAIDFALAYPEAVMSLILVDSSLSGYPWPPELIEDVRAVRTIARETGMQAAKQRWLQLPIFGPAQHHPEVAVRLAQIVADYSGWHWVNQDPVQSPEPPAIEQLNRVSIPTLVLVGERDVAYNQTITDCIHQGIPGARKVVIDGAGHMPNMEAPAPFNDTVLRFLAQS